VRKPNVLASSVALLVLLTIPLAARPEQRPAAPAAFTGATTNVAAAITAAGTAFLATLSEAERARCVFAFNDTAQKARWSNLPTGIFERKGLRLGDMTAPQRDAALKVLATALSRDGYRKITEIMNGDEVLRTGGGGRGGSGVRFGSAEYYLALLGPPSVTEPWMIQFGGHHLAINVTLVGRDNVMTPSLPAAQPATYTLNGETFRPLGDENDKAFALINALDPAQRKQAILAYQVNDLVLGAGQDGKKIQPEGILASALTAAQQDMLLDLAHEWVGILNDEAATGRMAEIKAALPNTYFAWSGPLTNGSAAYFRIQGPTLVIEYAPQRDVTHIHTIYRDPTNDYGAKLVK
jgi:Protein of unknown function (DUF3500)